MAPLIELCNTGFYWLKQEEAELKDRAKQKEEQGYTSRLKQGKKQITAAVSVATAGLLLRPGNPSHADSSVRFNGFMRFPGSFESLAGLRPSGQCRHQAQGGNPFGNPIPHSDHFHFGFGFWGFLGILGITFT